MTNKQKCDLARQIRKGIAEANGIVYLSAACPNAEECTGSCCICEAEKNHLDNEINRLASGGKKIVLSSINIDTACDTLDTTGVLAYLSAKTEQSHKLNKTSRLPTIESNSTFNFYDNILNCCGAQIYKKCNFNNILFEDLVFVLGSHGFYLSDCKPEEKANLYSYIERIYNTFSSNLYIEIRETKIAELNLSTQAFNVLKTAGITKVSDLMWQTKESFAKIRNMGHKTEEEIIAKLATLGVELLQELTAEKETYAELKARHQAETDAFPFGFAFNDKQFSEMMEKWGLAPDDTDKIYKIGGGGYIRKTDAGAMEALLARHKEELLAALCNEQIALEAVCQEEFLPSELTAYLTAFGLTLDDVNANPKLKYILQKAIEENEKRLKEKSK